MAASMATFTSSSLISDGNELSLSGEGEPESMASLWAVARELWGGEWERMAGRRGFAAFIWARNARGVCGGGVGL
jgi:hypothetical protein